MKNVLDFIAIMELYFLIVYTSQIISTWQHGDGSVLIYLPDYKTTYFIFLYFQRTDTKAHSPRFPKPKDEGWFIVIGDIENRELVALKRVGFVRNRSSQQVAIYTPETPGRVIYTLYLMSDCYIGLDQQYDICLDVIPASIESQVNTELVAELDDLDFGDD